MDEYTIPVAPPRSRRRRLVVAGTVAIVLATTSILVIVEIESIETRPIHFWGGNVAATDISSCQALEFDANVSGTLTSSWTSSSNSTAYIFSQGQFHAPAPGGECEAGAWGTPLWSGKVNVTADALSTHVTPGIYYLTFVVTKSPSQIIGKDLVLTPDPWFWL